MSLVQDKQARLVNALIKANQRGQLTWKLYDPEPGCVQTTIGETSIFLNDYHANQTDSVRLEIYANGDQVEAFLDDDLLAAEVPSVINETWFQTMTSLLKSARRKVSGADEVLDSLLKDLGE